MALLLNKPSCVAITVMTISMALFSEVIVGSACAKKLSGNAEKTNRNGRVRNLELMTDYEEEFIPEADVFGIVPEEWNEMYGFIPW